MKNIIKGIITILIITTVFAIGGYYDAHYSKKDCIILSVAKNKIAIQDPQGHIWHYETSGFSKGERVTMKMHSNYTDGYIKDDIILAVVKCDC